MNDRARVFFFILFLTASVLVSCTSQQAPVNLNRHESTSPSPVMMPSVQPSPKIQSSETPPPENAEPVSDTTLAGSYVGKLKLIIPVQGVKREQLQDTFMDARTEGRVHDAIDIPAPAGTPVLAAADGEIARLFQSELGGITIYQFSADKKLIYYYAHLQRYADGIAPGMFAHQGQVIAYVGDTGNAGAGNYHLHFSISVIPDPNRYWEGTSINPYLLLRQ